MRHVMIYTQARTALGELHTDGGFKRKDSTYRQWIGSKEFPAEGAHHALVHKLYQAPSWPSDLLMFGTDRPRPSVQHDDVLPMQLGGTTCTSAMPAPGPTAAWPPCT